MTAISEPLIDNVNISIDLSSCQSLDEIRLTIDQSMRGKERVYSQGAARRWFRGRKLRGRLRSDVVFREHKMIHNNGPLHRDVLVCVLVMEYRKDNFPDRVYSVELVTY